MQTVRKRQGFIWATPKAHPTVNTSLAEGNAAMAFQEGKDAILLLRGCSKAHGMLCRWHTYIRHRDLKARTVPSRALGCLGLWPKGLRKVLRAGKAAAENVVQGGDMKTESTRPDSTRWHTQAKTRSDAQSY